MTLEEIDSIHDLHDALIVSLNHDYKKAVVSLTVSLYVEGLQERREGVIEFEGVLYCAVDLPLPESSFMHPGELWITTFANDSERVPKDLIAQLPDGILRYSIFNRDWYSETHIAARNVSFRWSEDER